MVGPESAITSACRTHRSGPMLALCLAREDAVAEWRKLLTSAQPEENQESQEEGDKQKEEK